ncbi:hypothetical protein PFISCL1PPCAC_8013, partial [Pristionchus fissidentatus]
LVNIFINTLSNKTDQTTETGGRDTNEIQYIPTQSPLSSLYSNLPCHLPGSLRLSDVEDGRSLLESGRDVPVLGGIGESLVEKIRVHLVTTDKNFLLRHRLDTTKMSPVLGLVLPVVVHGLEDGECHERLGKSHSHSSSVVRS